MTKRSRYTVRFGTFCIYVSETKDDSKSDIVVTCHSSIVV